MCPLEKMQPDALQPNAGYAEPLDAIVLAGTDRRPERLIEGSNKAFLEIGGQVLVRRVVDTLLEASSIGHIYVVGPARELEKVLPSSPRVSVVDQIGKMLSNTWAGIRASEARRALSAGTATAESPMLFLSADLPLISAAAVEDFVGRCARQDALAKTPYSLLVGVAEEAVLRPFYPEGNKPGIVRPYVHLSTGRFRLSNIYVGRPHALTHQEFVQIGFSNRKAKNVRNVVALAWSFLSQGRCWPAAWLTVRLQITLMAARRKWRLYDSMRCDNTPERIERACSAILGGSVRLVPSPYGGLSLDVDDEKDFRVLSQRFEDWSGPQNAADPEPAS